MKPVHVCVPVLKRYDLLRELLTSLRDSSVMPTRVHIIDNGRCPERLQEALSDRLFSTDVVTPSEPMGVAASWNWFIENVPEERFIVNDDVVFSQDSLETMLASTASFVSCSFGFSCFLLRDTCVAKIGKFDETISPGYAYFEDMDYLRRMCDAGIVDEVVLCDVEHRQSATPGSYTEEEWSTHHERFKRAEANYRAKWGDPNWDQLKTIGGAGSAM